MFCKRSSQHRRKVRERGEKNDAHIPLSFLLTYKMHSVRRTHHTLRLIQCHERMWCQAWQWSEEYSCRSDWPVSHTQTLVTELKKKMHICAYLQRVKRHDKILERDATQYECWWSAEVRNTYAHVCVCVWSASESVCVVITPLAAPALIVCVQLWRERSAPAGSACWAATQAWRAKHPSKSLLDSANECGAQTIQGQSKNPSEHRYSPRTGGGPLRCLSICVQSVRECG